MDHVHALQRVVREVMRRGTNVGRHDPARHTVRATAALLVLACARCAVQSWPVTSTTGQSERLGGDPASLLAPIGADTIMIKRFSVIRARVEVDHFYRSPSTTVGHDTVTVDSARHITRVETMAPTTGAAAAPPQR